MKTILLLVLRPSDFVEMNRIKESLSDIYKFKIIYISPGRDQEFIEDPSLKIIQEDLVNILKYRQKKRKKRTTLIKLSKFLNKIYIYKIIKKKIIKKKILKKKIINIINTVFKYLKNNYIYRIIIQRKAIHQLTILKLYYKNYFLFKKIMSKNIDLLILAEDIVGPIHPVAIKAARKYNISTLIFPYTIANQMEAFQSLKSNTALDCNNHFFNLIFSFFFPRWALKRDGKKILRMPPGHILGHYFLNISPPDPWMMNSGKANQIIVESKKMYKYYVEAGITESKLTIGGALYDDILYNFRKNINGSKMKLKKKLNIKKNKKIFLINGCPDQSKNCPLFPFKDMTDFLINLKKRLFILKNHFEIVIRPHPNYKEFGDFFLKNSNFVVTYDDTAHLVAISDILLAFASATIRWGLLCKIPIINYDLFNYCYDDFSDESGVKTINSLEQLENYFFKIKSKTNFYHLKRNSEMNNNWGFMDGKTKQRVIKQIDKHL